MKKNLNYYIRLNRYLSICGISSRREADKLIESGLITVNGKIITKLGFKIFFKDKIKYDGYRIYPEKKIYIILNKPRGVITTKKDEKNRKTVMNLFYNQKYRIYPIGRLDRQSTGVLLFTNDGDITKKLTHPKYKIKKIYNLILDKEINYMDIKKIKNGISLKEGKIKTDSVYYLNKYSKNQVCIELCIGWKRVIRRIFKKIGYNVIKLDRVYFGGITKKFLKVGKWRFLTEKEINLLKSL